MNSLMPMALVVALSATPAAGTIPVRFESASEVKTDKELQAAIDKPFEAALKVKVGPKGPERSLANCAQLGIDFPGGQLETPDPVDQRLLLSQRAHCRALLWLKGAAPARESFLGELPPDLATAQSLPEAMIPTLGARRKKAAVRTSRTWKGADPKLALNPQPPPKPGLYLRGRGYEAELAFYGRGDFDGDGFEDVLIRVDAYPRQGSYQEFGLFLLTRTAAGAPFKVLRSTSEGY
jgi:hypothetical protein